MRPKKPQTMGESDLFRARLGQIMNMRHELVQLAGKIDWDWIDHEIALLWLSLRLRVGEAAYSQ
jgi:IS5 family transposase